MNVFSKKIPIATVFVLLLAISGCAKNHHRESEDVYFSGIGSGFARPFFEIVIDSYQKNNPVIINSVVSNPEMGIRSLRGKIIDFAFTGELPDETFFPGFEKNILALPVCRDKTARLSWVLVYKNQAYNGRNYAKYAQLKHFLKYLYSPENQRIITILGYEKLPDEIVCEALRKIDLMEWKDEKSIPAFRHFGLIASGEWFSVIGYSLLVSVLALIIAAPFSISLLLIYAEYGKGKKIAATLAFVMDLFAYIPSIVWGIWAYYNLHPLFDRLDIGYHGFGVLPVSIVLAVMIIPYSVSVCIRYVPFVPKTIKEGAYCLGATRLEIIGTIGFPFMTKGLIASGLLSLGKIMGETMVVVILFGKTLTSVIFNCFGTINDLEFNSLFALALFLFLITAGVNISARYMFGRLWHE